MNSRLRWAEVLLLCISSGTSLKEILDGRVTANRNRIWNGKFWALKNFCFLINDIDELLNASNYSTRSSICNWQLRWLITAIELLITMNKCNRTSNSWWRLNYEMKLRVNLPPRKRKDQWKTKNPPPPQLDSTVFFLIRFLWKREDEKKRKNERATHEWKGISSRS